MDASTWAAWAGIVIILLGGFGNISRKLGKMEVKIETLWNVFVGGKG